METLKKNTSTSNLYLIKYSTFVKVLTFHRCSWTAVHSCIWTPFLLLLKVKAHHTNIWTAPERLSNYSNIAKFSPDSSRKNQLHLVPLTPDIQLCATFSSTVCHRSHRAKHLLLWKINTCCFKKPRRRLNIISCCSEGFSRILEDSLNHLDGEIFCLLQHKLDFQHVSQVVTLFPPNKDGSWKFKTFLISYI